MPSRNAAWVKRSLKRRSLSQTRCFLVAGHVPPTGVCRQDKHSRYAVLPGLLCCFPGRRPAAERHTPPYHGLRAATSIHVVRCVLRNFPGRGESCCSLSELCKTLFFFSSKKSEALRNPFDSGRAMGEFSTKGRRNEATLTSLTSPPQRMGGSLLRAKCESRPEAAGL